MDCVDLSCVLYLSHSCELAQRIPLENYHLNISQARLEVLMLNVQLIGTEGGNR